MKRLVKVLTTLLLVVWMLAGVISAIQSLGGPEVTGTEEVVVSYGDTIWDYYEDQRSPVLWKVFLSDCRILNGSAIDSLDVGEMIILPTY